MQDKEMQRIKRKMETLKRLSGNNTTKVEPKKKEVKLDIDLDDAVKYLNDEINSTDDEGKTFKNLVRRRDKLKTLNSNNKDK